MMLKSCGVLILAAGQSARMGSPKFALQYADGLSFIENIVHQYSRAGCSKIVGVFNSAEHGQLVGLMPDLADKMLIVENPNAEMGRFSSLQCGLAALDQSRLVFVHNVDNPLAKLSVLEKLLGNIDDFDFAKPVYSGKGGHPILVKKNIVEAVLCKKNEHTNLRLFLKQFKGKQVEVDDYSILWNINKPEDLKQFEKYRSGACERIEMKFVKPYRNGINF